MSDIYFLLYYIMDNFNNDSSFTSWDINSITNFFKNNIVQILLLISVFVIIYIVDYINNINAAIFGLQSVIPGIPGMPAIQDNKKQIIKVSKGKKHSRKITGKK